MKKDHFSVNTGMPCRWYQIKDHANLEVERMPKDPIPAGVVVHVLIHIFIPG